MRHIAMRDYGVHKNRIGRFRIRDVIDHGEYGIVYRAVNLDTLSEIALKLVPKKKGEDVLDAHRRGARVQKLLADADRRGRVVKILSVRDSKQGLLIEMEEAFGEKLQDKIRSGMDISFSIKIAKDIYQVLQIAHNFPGEEDEPSFNAIIHGDLKPSNIFVDGDKIKLIDFGSSKETRKSQSLTKGDFGTVEYCSPERIEDKTFTVHVDLWAAGIILYQMIVGDLPYSPKVRESVPALEQVIRAGRVVNIPKACPDPLKRIITKILAPELKDRYQSAAEVIADLERFEKGEPTAAESERKIQSKKNTSPTQRTDLAANPIRSDGTEGSPTRRTSEHDHRRANEPFPDEVPQQSVTSESPPIVNTPPTRRTNHAGRIEQKESAKSASSDIEQSPVTWRRTLFRLLVFLAFIIPFIVGLLFLLNEITVRTEAADLGQKITAGEVSDPNKAWSAFKQLTGRSRFNFGTSPARQPLKDMLVKSADRIIADYLNDYPTIGDKDYEMASSYLDHALELDLSDNAVKARKLYCDGHLDRKAAEAKRKIGKSDEAFTLFNSAIEKMKEASVLRPEWSDPHLALARIHTYGLRDPEAGMRELSEAERYDHHPGKRDKALLADAYSARGHDFLAESKRSSDKATEEQLLGRAKQDYQQALAGYRGILPFGDSRKNLEAANLAITQIEQREKELREPQPEAEQDSKNTEFANSKSSNKVETVDCKIVQLVFSRPNLTFKFYYGGHYSYEFDTCNGCPVSGDVEIPSGTTQYTARSLIVKTSGSFRVQVTDGNHLVCYKTFGR